MHLIAEGAEEKHHYDFLKEQGCNEVQGYYYSAPLPVSELETMFLEQELERVGTKVV